MAEEKHDIKRRPVAHFFVKPKLQMRFTMLFIIVSLVLSSITLGITFLLIRLDIDGLEGIRTAWFFLKATYPGFWIVATVSIIVGCIVGIIGSRKVALPIYKVEQWSKNLQNGDLSKPLGMRESDFWGEMAESCNTFTRELRENLTILNKSIDADGDSLRGEVKKMLSKYHFEG